MKIIVNGAQGKMGKTTVAAIEASPGFELVGTGSRDTHLPDLIKKHAADVVIDFTSPDVAWDHLKTIIDAGVHPVIGSSGLTPEQIKEAQTLCADKKLGGIIAPNFALGAVLMMKYAADCAKYFPHADIVEMHHPNKLDAPSGTAVKTAALIAQNRGGAPSHKSTESVKGALGASVEGVPVHAVRISGVLANQVVTFGAPGQTLTIRHDTLDRGAFMPGVLMSCEKVMEIEELVYGLENII